MIITSNFKLELNKYYDEQFFKAPFQARYEFIDKYKFLVIRESTLEEYRSYVAEVYNVNPDQFISFEYFYKIHTD